MVNVQDLITRAFRAGVNTTVVKFDQHILPQFKALKLALLILDALYLGVLHQLRVESDQLYGYPLDRICAGESSCPGVDVLDPALK